MRQNETYYDVLGVEPSASTQQIKEAYRRRAMKWHPDRCKDKVEAEAQFKKIGLAYRVLSNAELRAEYDESLRAAAETASNARYSDKASAPGASGRGEETAGRQQDDMSWEAANELFFQQMLDLAVELAGKGLDGAAVERALTSFGCPPAMARSLGTMVEKMSAPGRSGRRPAGTSEADVEYRSLGDADSAPWEELEPYFAAFVGGREGGNQISDEQFDQLQRDRKRRRRALFIGIAGLLAAAAVFALVVPGKVPAGLIFLTALGAGIALVAWAATEIYADFRHPSFRKSLRTRAFLSELRRRQFKDRRFASPYLFFAPVIFSVFWIAYRRMPWAVVLYFIAVFAGGAAIDAAGFSDSVTRALSYGLTGGLSIAALEWYLFKARREVHLVAAMPKQQALERLRRRGGTSAWSSVAVMFLLVLGVGGLLWLGEADDARSTASAHAPQAAQPTMQGETESVVRARVDPSDVPSQSKGLLTPQRSEAERYDSLVTMIESQYPELNPDSPRFNERAVEIVAQRLEKLKQQGWPPSDALARAVYEYDRDFRSVQRASRRQGVKEERPSQRPEAQFESARIICGSFPQACRD